MTKTILVLGGSYVGLTVAHKLLKTTLKTADYKIVLVNPSTHHYWNLASVRAIVPGQISDSKIFASIPDGFKSQPATKFQLILGLATAIDASAKSVKITTNDGAELVQDYDTLIIATGSRTNDVGAPWKSSMEGYEATKEALHKTQEKVKAAKKIVLGGGGPTGVETSGEIAFEFGKTKEVTLVTASSQLLPGVPANVASSAENELKKLGIKIIYNTKVLSSTASEVTLSNGEKLPADLYLPTSGIKLNTEFVPAQFKNDKGEVVIDEFFRVKNATDIWAAGDVTDVEPPQLAFAQGQAAHLAKNLDLVLKGGKPLPYKVNPPTIAVTLGRSKATGRRGNMKFPSIVVWLLKGRTLFMQQQKGLVDGSAA